MTTPLTLGSSKIPSTALLSFAQISGVICELSILEKSNPPFTLHFVFSPLGACIRREEVQVKLLRNMADGFLRPDAVSGCVERRRKRGNTHDPRNHGYDSAPDPALPGQPNI